jgi:hypothetical protein
MDSIKFFQYLGTGNPILALAPEGEVRDIIAATRGGLSVPPDDAAAASRPSRRCTTAGRMVQRLHNRTLPR